MSNIIDSIRVSGVTYTISGQSSGGNPTVELTQAEYDALVSAGTVSSNTFYIITDATPVETSGFVETSAVTSAVTTASTDSQIPTAKAVKAAVDAAKTEARVAAVYEARQYTDEKIYEFSGITDAAISAATSGKADTSALTTYFGAVAYDTSSKHINFYNTSTDGTVLAYVDATDFIKDGMVDNVEIKDVTLSGQSVTCLVVTFNTDSGKEDINIPIYEIFNANNYYTKSEVNGAISAATSGKVETSAITSAVTSASTDSQIPTAKAVYDAIPTGGSVTSGEVQTMINQSISGKADSSTVEYIDEKVNDVYSRYVNYITDSVSYENNYIGLQYGQDGSSLDNVVLFGVGEGLTLGFNHNNYDLQIDTGWLASELAPVATTGDYNDLYNTPYIDNTVTSGSTNAVQGGAVYSQMGGLKFKKLTQAQYNALAPNYDANTIYFIKD